MELWDVKVVAREVLVEDLEVCKQERGWPLLFSCGQMNKKIDIFYEILAFLLQSLLKTVQSIRGPAFRSLLCES